jgi:hypothetical protein
MKFALYFFFCTVFHFLALYLEKIALPIRIEKFFMYIIKEETVLCSPLLRFSFIIIVNFIYSFNLVL